MSADNRVINDDDPDDGRMFGHEHPDEGSINSELMPDGANTESQQAIAKTAIVYRDCPGKYLQGLIAEQHFQNKPWNAPAEGTISKYLSEFNLRTGRDRANAPEVKQKWADAREATRRVKMVKDYQRKGKHEQPYLLAAGDDELNRFIDKTRLSTRNIAQLDPKDSIAEYVSRRAEEFGADADDDSVESIETENGNASFSGDPIDDRMQHIAERPDQDADPKGQAAETTEESPSSDDSMEQPLDVMGGDADGYANLDTVGVDDAPTDDPRVDPDSKRDSHEIEIYDDEIVDVIRALLNDRDVPDAVAKRAIKNV